MVQWCRRLIATPSVTSDGTRAIAELCARELLAPARIEARLIPSTCEGNHQVNLVAIVRGLKPDAAPLVLNTHLDTVPPGDPALWTECGGDPFRAKVDGDRIYGLGAADTKLDFVAKAIALAQCGRPRRDVYMVGTFGEEHGLVGAKEIARAGIIPRGALGFIGEPSRLKLIVAHKGLTVFELRLSPAARKESQSAGARDKLSRIAFAGRAAHSSTPHLGRNAIVVALDFLAAHPELAVAAIEGGDVVNKVPARCETVVRGPVPKLPPGATATADAGRSAPDALAPAVIAAAAKFAEALKNFADRSVATGAVPEPDFAASAPVATAMTCNVGKIRTADGALVLEFELQPPPGLALESVRNGVKSICSILRRRFRGLEVHPGELRANPGFRARADSPTLELAMAALAQAGLGLETDVKAGCTEAGVYAAAGLYPIVVGPGPSTGVIHAPNEYGFISEVEAAVRFYRHLLEL